MMSMERIEKLKMKLEILKLMADDYNWQCHIPGQVKAQLLGTLAELNLEEGLESYILMEDKTNGLFIYYDKAEAERAKEARCGHKPEVHIVHVKRREKIRR